MYDQCLFFPFSPQAPIQLLVVSVLRRLLEHPSLLARENDVTPAQSRTYAVLDLCVVALSTFQVQRFFQSLRLIVWASILNDHKKGPFFEKTRKLRHL
jgi:hypothetical protein